MESMTWENAVPTESDEETFRAWNDLEDVLNRLTDLGETPEIMTGRIIGRNGRVAFSEIAGRWVRQAR